MDDVNRFARELADAIAAAVAANPEVEACRERARAAGFEMRVSLEAVVGFMSRENRDGRDKGPPPRSRRSPPPPACCRRSGRSISPRTIGGFFDRFESPRMLRRRK